MGKKNAGRKATILEAKGDATYINFKKKSQGGKKTKISRREQAIKDQLQAMYALKEQALKTQIFKLKIIIAVCIVANILIAQVAWQKLSSQSSTLEKITDTEIKQEQLLQLLHDVINSSLNSAIDLLAQIAR